LIGFAALVLVLALVIWTVARFHLRGQDLSAYDQPQGQQFCAGSAPSAELGAVVASLGRVSQSLKGVPRRRQIHVLRDYLDNMFADEGLGATFTPVDAGGVPGEWVRAPNAEGARRLLYIHGGAFTMGSPRSHRRLTSKFSEISGAAVLAIDYRLMPEHSRMAGIEDCRTAYRWMLDNGPDGRGEAAAVYVAGDSAGGNLTLSLIAWVRDQRLRAPDAAVALSPLTDSTLASPSIKTNIPTDPMLGPLFGLLARIPRALMLWGTWIQTRINPSDPSISPVYGDLSNLPPVLVQASEAEMLRDDARRWVNRAVAAGSPARLQTWPHMVHVWQIFFPELTEGRAAFDQIREFLAAASRSAPPTSAPP
jgi:monoterpene epsilon-lactone hydrolase